MKSTLLAVSLLVVCVAAFTEQEYKDAFTNWVQKYQKSYAVSEFQGRYDIFKSNMNFVQAWNADSIHTHTVGLNQFADLSNEEYQRIYLATHFDGTERLANAAPHHALNVTDNDVNWANMGAVTPVKNQGQCGSCWAFSATGSVEALTMIKMGNLTSLSEQNLMDCSSSYGNAGCSGGWIDSAFQYIIANKGIDQETYYPYQGVVGTCNYQFLWTGAIITFYIDLNSGDENGLANTVIFQPVSVVIDASLQSFQFYSSGVYSDPACSSSDLDHAVLVVGYGSDDGDYWIVKNSWGTDWGMSGYIWMARNESNMCGIATMASIPKME